MKKSKNKCGKCGETKSSKFSPSAKNMCRECNNEYQRKKREENKLNVLRKKIEFAPEYPVKLMGAKLPQGPDTMPMNTVEEYSKLSQISPVEYESSTDQFISKIKAERIILEDRLDAIESLLSLYLK